jgi:hypothetical protein
MEKTEKKNIKPIIAVIALCAVVALALVAYFVLVPTGTEGAKTFYMEVIVDGEVVYSQPIRTDEAYLRGALEDVNLIQGEETTFGLWVLEVNGRFADDSKEEWWALYVNGDFAMFGVDEMPIEDGDKFNYILMVGYDDMGW